MVSALHALAIALEGSRDVPKALLKFVEPYLEVYRSESDAKGGGENATIDGQDEDQRRCRAKKRRADGDRDASPDDQSG